MTYENEDARRWLGHNEDEQSLGDTVSKALDQVIENIGDDNSRREFRRERYGREDYAELLQRRLNIHKLLQNLNRDYANDSGEISGGRLKMVLSSSNSSDSSIISIDSGVKAHSTYAYGRNVLAFLTCTQQGIPNGFSLTNFNRIVNWAKTIPTYSQIKGSEARKIKREMNKTIRGVLKKRGFKVTPEARIRKAWEITRNAGAIIGGSYATSAVLYRVAESFVQLPKIPIFP